jgi:hypothetical protein
VCRRAPRRLIVPAIFPSAPLAYIPYTYYVPCSSCDLSFWIWLLSFLFGHIAFLSIFNMILDSGILPYLTYAYFIRYALRGIPPTPMLHYPILHIVCIIRVYALSNYVSAISLQWFHPIHLGYKYHVYPLVSRPDEYYRSPLTTFSLGIRSYYTIVVCSIPFRAYHPILVCSTTTSGLSLYPITGPPRRHFPHTLPFRHCSTSISTSV